MIQDARSPHQSARTLYVSIWWCPVGNHRATSTQRTYARQWNLWTEWAVSNGRDMLPANSRSVADYLSYRLSDGASHSTVKMARAAIGAYHRDAGETDPTTGECVRRVLSVILPSDTFSQAEVGIPSSRHTILTHESFDQQPVPAAPDQGLAYKVALIPAP